MEKTEKIDTLLKALFAFQKSIGTIKTTAENPFFKNSYVDLAGLWKEIKQPLQKQGLGITQLLKGCGVETVLFHAESCQYISSYAELKPTKEDPQGYGSAITYTKRYAILAILGIVAEEDDDGNKGSNTTLPPKTPRKPYNKQENNDQDKEWLNEISKATKAWIIQQATAGKEDKEIVATMRKKWKISKKLAAEISEIVNK